jgi:uncharacterized repeat protein (TIGR01451 family)/LPXTG-motif cell wall-anchored protein
MLLVASTLALAPTATAFATEATPVPTPDVAASSTEDDAGTEEALESSSTGEAAPADGEVTTTADTGAAATADSSESQPAQLADTGQSDAAKAAEPKDASAPSTTQTQTSQEAASSSSEADITVNGCLVTSTKEISNIEFFGNSGSLGKDESIRSTTFDLRTFAGIAKVDSIVVKSGTTSEKFTSITCSDEKSQPGDGTGVDDKDSNAGGNDGGNNNGGNNNNGNNGSGNDNGGSNAPVKNDGTNGNGRGANTGCEEYAPTAPDGDNAGNGNAPPDGTKGNADDKCPPGQLPFPDPDSGFECDENQGVGKGNPAHTVPCKDETSPAPLTISVQKTNDADRDGDFSDAETADLPGQSVDFKAVITNTSGVDVVVTSITDTYNGRTITPDCQDALVGSTIADGGEATCSFTVRNYAPSAANDSIVNTVRVVASEAGRPENRTSAQDDSKVLGPEQVATAPDLAVDKNGPATGVAGGTGTYTIRVKNVSSSAVTDDIVVTDELPSGEVATSATGPRFDCDITDGGQLVTCTRTADLRGKASTGVITVAVAYADDASGTLTDTARVEPVTGETNTDNNEDTVDTVIGDGPVTGDDPAVQKVTFCHATGSATNPFVVITTSVNAIVGPGGHDEHQDGRDVIPPFTYIDRNGQQQTFPGQNLGADGVFDIEEDCQVAVLPNPPADKPDLAVDKNGPETGVAGGTGTYTIVVTNEGTATVTDDIIVTDTLPEGATATSVPSSPGFSCEITNSGATVTCKRSADLAAGDSTGTISVAVSFASNAEGPLTDVARVVPVTGETNTDNNRDEVTTTIPESPVLDLAVSKTDEGASAVAGGTVNYTVTVRNVGNQPISAFTLAELPQPGLTVLAISGGSDFACTPSGCTYTGAPLAPNAFRQLMVTASVGEAVDDEVTNIVEIDAPGDENATNDRAVEDTPVVGGSVTDVRIIKTDADASGVRGGTVTYTVTVTNVGNQPVSSFTLTEQPEQGLTVTAITGGPAGFACQDLVCTYGGAPLLPGQAMQLTVTASVDADAPDTVTNVVEVDAPGDDNDTNDRDEEDTPVVEVLPNPPTDRLDLRIVKTDDVPAGGSVRPGDTLTYTLQVFNDGGAAVSGFVVTDTLPAGLTLRSVSGDGFTCDGLVCTFAGSLPVGDSATITVVTVVNEDVGEGTLLNTATVPLEGDPTPENNTDTETTPVVEVLPEEPTDRPDVAIVKDDAGASVRPGGQLTYTLTVTNEGLSAASGIRVTDSLPNGLTLDRVRAPGFRCMTSASMLDCSYNGSLAAGESAVITVVTTLASNYTAGTVSNTAVVQPLPNETDTSDNTSTERTPVIEVQDNVFDRPAPPAQVDDVQAQGPQGPDSLPFTGAETDSMIAVAGLMLLVGVAALLAGRRRPVAVTG